MKELPFISEPKLTRRAPDYSIIHHFSSISSSSEQSNVYHPYTPPGYYRRIYYEALDSLTLHLKKGLINPALKFMKI